MPLICGPKNSRFTFTGSPCPHLDLALQAEALTLGAAIAAYEKHFRVAVRPCTERLPGEAEIKYFTHLELDSQHLSLVDIHVLRDGEAICPKQDLGFSLLAQDLVELGELIC